MPTDNDVLHPDGSTGAPRGPLPLSEELRQATPADLGPFHHRRTFRLPAAAYVCVARPGEQLRQLVLGAADEEAMRALTLLAAGMSREDLSTLGSILATGDFAAALIGHYLGLPGKFVSDKIVMLPENLLGQNWTMAVRQLEGSAQGALQDASPSVKLFIAALLCAFFNGAMHGAVGAEELLRPVPGYTTLRVDNAVVRYEDFTFGFWLNSFGTAVAAQLTKLTTKLHEIKTAQPPGKLLPVATFRDGARALFESIGPALAEAELPAEALKVVLSELRMSICYGTFSQFARKANLVGMLEGLLANVNLILMALDESIQVTAVGLEEIVLMQAQLERLMTGLNPTFGFWTQIPIAEFAAMYDVDRVTRPTSAVPVMISAHRRVPIAQLLDAAQTVYMTSTGLSSTGWSLLKPMTADVRTATAETTAAAASWERALGAPLRESLASLVEMNGPWHPVSAMATMPSEELWILAMTHFPELVVESLSDTPLEAILGRRIPPRTFDPARPNGAKPAELEAINMSAMDLTALRIHVSLRVPLENERLSTEMALPGLAEEAEPNVAVCPDPLIALLLGQLRTGLGERPFEFDVFQPPVQTKGGAAPAFPYVQLADVESENADRPSGLHFSPAALTQLHFEQRLRLSGGPAAGGEPQEGRRTVRVDLPPVAAGSLINPSTHESQSYMQARIAEGDLVAGPYVAARAADALRIGLGSSHIVRAVPPALAQAHLDALLRIHQLVMQLPADSPAARDHAQRNLLIHWLAAAETPFTRAIAGHFAMLTRMLTFMQPGTLPTMVALAAYRLAILREVLAAITKSKAAYSMWRTLVEALDLDEALERNILLLVPRPLVTPALPGGKRERL